MQQLPTRVLKRGATRLLGPRRVQLLRGWAAGLPCPPPASEVVYVPQGERPRVLFPSYPPPGYLGQLDPAFQRRLAAERAFVEREDCYFYHTSELANGDVVPGPWDLRGGEPEYLGEVELPGKRVLELGPASGHLSRYMERRGADVVALDVGFDLSVDIMPVPGTDPIAKRQSLMRFIGAVQNSWWYLRRDSGCNGAMIYGNIYDLPRDIGTFDVSVFGCILLHLRDPFTALAQAAARTTGAIVVTDTIGHEDQDPNDNIIHFDPVGNEVETVWWELSPGAVAAMLGRLGFSQTRLTLHRKPHYRDHEMGGPPEEVLMYTLVCQRP